MKRKGESEEGEEGGGQEEITDDREIKVKIESEEGVRFQKAGENH